MIHFVALLLAGVAEIFSVYFMSAYKKQTKSKKWLYFICTMSLFAISLLLLRFSMKVMQMSVAYAIWTGIGAIGAVFVGIIFDNEKFTPRKASFLSIIVISVIMLKVI